MEKNNYWCHKTVEIEEGTVIGQGTKIWNNCQIKKGAIIGENCTIGHNCLINEKAIVGNGCKLQSNIDIWGGVTLQDNVFVGPSVVFTNDLNPRAKYPKSQYPEYGKWVPTLIKEGATLGANATIVCGAVVGKWAMVGAGAVVKKDVLDYSIVVGNPAKQIGWICECGNKLEFIEERSVCKICKRIYQTKEDKVWEIVK